MRAFLLIAFCAVASAAAAQGQYGFRYWFDGADGSASVGTASDGDLHIDIDASALPEGLHTLHWQVAEADSGASVVKTVSFLKTPAPSRGYRYWFDGADAAAVAGSVAGQTVAAVDVAALAAGLHTFHYQLADSAGGASVVRTSAFIKMPQASTAYRYWFDNADTAAVAGTAQGGQVAITADAAKLATGLHALHYQMAGGESGGSVARTAWFVKLPTFSSAGSVVYIDGKRQDGYASELQGDTVIHLDIDADALDLGLHTVEARAADDGGSVSPAAKSFFLRVPTAQDIAGMRACYFIDGSQTDREASVISQGVAHVDLDMAGLQDGVHTITFLMSNDKGMATVAGNYAFLKDSRGILSYSWWINDDRENAFTRTFASAQSSVEIMESLDPPRYGVRARSFEFAVEDSVPVAYPVNTFHFSFTDRYGSGETSQFDYIDLAAREEVAAKQIVSDATEATGGLQEDSIAWYKFIGTDGDSISIKADSACVVQLFLPTGESLARMEGDSATTAWSANLSADGVYYIAVHSPATKGGNINVDFHQRTDNPVVSVRSVPTAAKPKRDVVYDLSGRRVYGELRPGIYIINGRKVLVRK